MDGHSERRKETQTVPCLNKQSMEKQKQKPRHEPIWGFDELTQESNRQSTSLHTKEPLCSHDENSAWTDQELFPFHCLLRRKLEVTTAFWVPNSAEQRGSMVYKVFKLYFVFMVFFLVLPRNIQGNLCV